MTKPGDKAPPKGRLTSTGLHPRSGVPPPERLVAKRTRAAVTQVLGENSLPNEWQAGVSKVETCSLAEYDGGRGLRTIFSKERDSKRRCNILCSGNTSKLAISLELAERHRDPSPHILHRFELPDNDNSIGLRLYDVDVSIEIREHPKNPRQRKSQRRAEVASGGCWVIHLEVSLKEQVLMKAKKMLRRLESIAWAMPSDWFSYRNFFVKSTDSVDSNVNFGDGVFAQTFVGGYTWRFTGNLASAEFRQALTGQLAGKEKEMPTRLQPYRTAKGKKAAKGLPAKQRRLERVQRREASQETPEVMDEQDDVEPLGPLPSSSPFHFSSEIELDDGKSEKSGESDESGELDESDKSKSDESDEFDEYKSDEFDEYESDESDEFDEAPIEGLLDKRTRNGKVEYEVQWTGPYKPTWEPAAHVSAVSIAEFEKNNASKPKMGRRTKSKQPSRANAPMTRSAKKAAEKLA